MKPYYLFIFIVTSIFSMRAQEGEVKTYYPGGAVESVINYKENLRDGEAKFYYENGKIKEERVYVNGRVEGVLKIYYENGNLKELANLENGKREGPTSLFNEEGVYLSDIEFLEGKRIMPEPEVKETLIASSDIIKEETTPPVKKENNIERSENHAVPPPLEDTMEDDPAFFSTAEVMPQPVGGMNAVYKKLVYPREAKAKEIEGTVKLLLYIDEWGDVTQAEVAEGIGYGCDESAKTALYYTKFTPGLMRGKAVKMRITVPVEFKLPR